MRPLASIEAFYRGTFRPERIGLRPGTVRQYDQAVDAWTRWGRGRPLIAILDSDLSRFAVSLLDGREAATVNKVLRHLMAVLREARRRRLLKRLPRWRKLKEPTRAPLAFTVQENAAAWRLYAELATDEGVLFVRAKGV